MIIKLISALLLSVFFSAEEAEWSPNVFDYNRAARLQVRDAKNPDTGTIAGATQQHLIFRDLKNEDVPVLITVPRGPGPFPVVLLVHGFASTKEQITRQVAPALIQRGMACAAIDLPMHGLRKGPPAALFDEAHPKKTYEHVVQAVTDLRQTIDLLETRKDLNASAGVYLAGYSMGGWIGALAGASERRVPGMVLMVPVSEAAALEQKPKTILGRGQKALLERYASLRPTGAVDYFGPRPLLIQAGNKDVYLPKDAAEALLSAAHDPRELRWYDSGHILPDQAMNEAAAWIKKQLESKNSKKK